MTGLCLCDKVGQGEVGIGTCHEVGMMAIQQIILHALSHTAEDADEESPPHVTPERGFSPQRIQFFQAMVDFLLCIVAYGTGVQKNSISLFKGVASLVACHLHDGGHHFGVGHIHLAAVSFNIQFLHLLLGRARQNRAT